jgi:PAS domain S-box-containing protein
MGNTMSREVTRERATGIGRETAGDSPHGNSPPTQHLLEERLRFESLLVDLSATFVNVPADRVDAQIEETQQRLVEFLGVDRTSFGEFSLAGQELRITHSYAVPGCPPQPAMLVDGNFPWYAAQMRRGEVIRFERLPDELPAEAAPEKAYCLQTGFKSHLAIPLKVAGSVVCVVMFGSFRAYRSWPDELVQRLRLVGEVLANALVRKRSEEALRLSEERFRQLANSAPVMVWMSGPDRLCTWFNKSWLDFTGRTLDQERGNGWAEGVLPEDRDGCLRTYVAAFDARQPFTMDYRLRRHDGEYRWVLDNGTPLWDAGNTFAGYIGSALDITERKRAEENLRASHKGQRELASRLLHAQEEERRRIAREMHDDWTQRLAVLAIDASRVEQQLGSGHPSLASLAALRERLVSLSEDVHALSRQLHPSILDDLGLADALLSECASFTRRESITVDYHPGGVPQRLPRDVALCVYRVAQEALRNIARHARVTEARVSLVGSGQELLLVVEDEGVGFDPAAVRSQPALGLSSMEERVRLIQGELTIRSEPGQGTTVAVRVPLSRRKT